MAPNLSLLPNTSSWSAKIKTIIQKYKDLINADKVKDIHATLLEQSVLIIRGFDYSRISKQAKTANKEGTNKVLA